MNKNLLRISIALNIILILAGAYFVAKRIYYHNPLPYWHWTINEEWKMRAEIYQSYPESKDDIIFIGNSLIELCNWNELFENEHIKNRGIGGDMAEGLLTRLPGILKVPPKKIFLEIGTNDIKLSNAFPVTTYRKIVETIKQKCPTTEIYLISIFPRQGFEKIITDANEKIKQSGGTYVDLYSSLVENGELRKDLTIDGVHVNYKGYQICKEALLPFINQL